MRRILSEVYGLFCVPARGYIQNGHRLRSSHIAPMLVMPVKIIAVKPIWIQILPDSSEFIL